MFLYSCSTKKNTWSRRAYHNISTHYNVYWNGNESFKTGVKLLNENITENYSLILPVYNFGTPDEARKIYSDMDKAIDKAGIAIPRHSMYFKKKEYNKWIDDCYLLIGKAQFYKQDYFNSRRTMEYLMNDYAGEQTELEAIIWETRAFLQQKRYEDVVAQGEKLEAIMAKQNVPYKIQREIPLLYADYYIRTGNYEAAKTNLKQGLALASSSKLKSRINFILGQIAEKEKNFAEATDYFSKVIRSSTSPEMIFNAQINLAKSFDVRTGDKAGLEKQLKRMLRDSKNNDYYDQIYFALAELAALDNNDTLVKFYLTGSVASSTKNNFQKSTSSLQLADIFFKEQNYESAALYYDTTIQVLPKEHPDYIAISSRTTTLSELVKNLQVVQYEDSLQKLARLPDAELLAAINKIIDKINEEENRLRELEQQQQNEINMLSNTPNFRNENMQNIGGGGWYFYNPSAISFGFSEFLRKWGRRKLEDNWRLSNKRITLQQDELALDPSIISDSLSKQDTVSGSKQLTDIKNPQSYIALLPKTPEALAASNKLIAGALVNLGYIYKDGLKDFPHSVEAFEDLVRRFPDSKEIVRIYYQLYLIGNEIPDEELSKKYGDIVLTNYGETEYAQLIKDPDFNKELLAQKNRVSSLYEETYQAFKRGQYKVVLLYSNQAIRDYNDKDLIPRFEYLRALALGKTTSVDTMVVALNKLVLDNPAHPITPLAQEMLAKYDKSIKATEQPAAVADSAAIAYSQNIPLFSGPNPFTQNADTAVPDIYKVNPNQTHFYILLVDGNKVNVNATKVRISDFILKNFGNDNLAVNAIVLDDGWQMISVSSFKNADASMDFYHALRNDEYATAIINKSDYKGMVISMENYPVFYREKKYGGYLNFFNKYYNQQK